MKFHINARFRNLHPRDHVSAKQVFKSLTLYTSTDADRRKKIKYNNLNSIFYADTLQLFNNASFSCIDRFTNCIVTNW